MKLEIVANKSNDECRGVDGRGRLCSRAAQRTGAGVGR